MHERSARLLHDARGPLNSISMHAELAKLLARRQGASEQLLSALDVILRDCQRCDGILQTFAAGDVDAADGEGQA